MQNSFRDFVFIFSVFFVFCKAVHAQEVLLEPASYFINKNVETNEGTVSLPNFGFSLNAYSGLPQLKKKIISIPGNNEIPVEAWVHLDGFYNSGLGKPKHYQGYVEVPRITGAVICSYGERNAIGEVGNYDIDGEGNYVSDDDPGEHTGTFLHLPGQHAKRLSPTDKNKWQWDSYEIGVRTALSFSDNADYGSTDNYQAFCHADVSDPNQIQNSHVTMDVKSPNGLTYTFERPSTTYFGQFHGGNGILRVATISDQFGNSVNYTYTSDNGATVAGISSTDGRNINFSNGINNVISTNDRQWTISSGSPTVDSRYLNIENPDGLSLKYEFSGFLKDTLSNNNSLAATDISNNYCNGGVGKIKVTSPYSAVVDITVMFKALWSPSGFIQYNGPGNLYSLPSHQNRCSVVYSSTHPVANVNETYFKQVDRLSVVPAVTSIQITEPVSSETYTWGVDYEEGWGQTLGSDFFELEREITFPDGSSGKYLYQSDARSTIGVGSLISAKIFGGNDTLLSKYTPTYEYMNMNLNPTGVDLNIYRGARSSVFYPNRNSEISMSKGVKLLTKSVEERDGDTYTTEYSYNMDVASSSYSYGNPIQTKSYSNVSTTPRITDTTYEYNSSNWILGLPKTVTQNGRLLVTNNYDPNTGQLRSRRKYGASYDAATFEYNSDGTLAAYEDALDRRTEVSDWHRGVPRLIKQAVVTSDLITKSITKSRTVDDNGWLMSSTDAMGRTTDYSRDDMGRLTLINPTGNFWLNTSIDYDFSGGGAVQTITKGQSKQTITYDSMFRPTLERSQALDTGWSSYINTEYDALGRVKFKSQPSDNPSESKGMAYIYNGLGQILSEVETTAPHATTSYYYYPGHRLDVVHPDATRTRYYSHGYDGPGNKDYRAIYHWENGIYLRQTDINKNIHGQLISVRQRGNMNGHSVDKTQYFKYDTQQRLCNYYTHEQNGTRYQYDAAGQMIAYAKGIGSSNCAAIPNNLSAKVSQSYDDLGRLALTDFTDPATADISRTYDDNGNLKTINRDGVNWSYYYNDLNLLTGEYLDIDGRNFDSYFYYNASAYLTRKRLPSGRNIYYTPDGLGRAQSIRNGSATLASNTSFHANGALAGMSYGNGQLFTQTLNNRLLPQRLLSAYGAHTAIDQTLSYDARGRVTSILDGAVSGNNRSYGYDGLGQVVTASGPWGPNGAQASGSYTYDSLGNLRQKTLGARTVDLSYNSLNRLSQSADTGASGTRTVAYDPQGNVTTLGNLAFLYDYSNQPVVVSGTANGVGAANGNYVYDGNLKRVKSVVNGKTIYNVYDASGGLVHIDAVTDNKITDYVSGPMGPLARITNNNVTYLHPDHLGSAQAGTKPDGTVEWREQYTPFGEELQSPAANDNLAGFTGHIKDKATGLNYMQARYYDPVIGRFLSIDAIDFMGSGGNPQYFNRYAYTFNDPINNLDPDGNVVETVWDVANVGLGAASLGHNLSQGNYGSAALDGVGLLYDGFATAVPFLPAGAGAGLKAARAGNSVKNSITVGSDVAKVANATHSAAKAADTGGNAAVAGTRIHQQVGDAVNLSGDANNYLRGANGATGPQPDVSWNAATNVWADVTTPGQWQNHVNKYGDDFGEGVGVLYERGKGVVNSPRLTSGAGAAIAGGRCALGDDGC